MPALKNLQIEFFGPFTLKKELFENKNFNLTIATRPEIATIIKEIPSNIPLTITLENTFSQKDEVFKNLNIELKDIIKKHGNIKIER